MKTVIAIPADTHSGSCLGLIPPHQWQLDDGGHYDPSTAQREVLWAQWAEAWERVKKLRKGGRLIVIHNGDCVEGTHDRVMAVFSRRRDTQERIHVACMDWALQTAKFKQNDSLYYIRGTAWHTGRGCASDERIAEDMGAVPARDSAYSHYHLRLNVDGVLLDVAHHGPGPGVRAWTKENSLYHTVKSIYLDCIEESRPVPDAWVRSHFHQWVNPQTYSGNHGTITGFLTPAFQLTTPFGIKKSKAIKNASVGMLIIVVKDGKLTWECPHVTHQYAPIMEA